MVRCAVRAEQLLRDALVPFQPLDDKRIERREDFVEHLDGLKLLLRKHKVHLVGSEVGPLAPWSETEKALGISESQRKVKVGLLRLDPDEQDRVRPLPQEHAVQISRLPDRGVRDELIGRAAELTHRDVRRAVDRLLSDPELDVDAALASEEAPAAHEALAFDGRLELIADLCRQLARAIRNLGRLDSSEHQQVADLIATLDGVLDAFRDRGLVDK